VFPDPAAAAVHDANYAVFTRLHAALASTDVGDLVS
jgi:hypothetical protein